jgi:hypothetical protein
MAAREVRGGAGAGALRRLLRSRQGSLPGAWAAARPPAASPAARPAALPCRPAGRLHFVKFETNRVEDAIDFIEAKGLHRYQTKSGSKEMRVKATGGGAYKYAGECRQAAAAAAAAAAAEPSGRVQAAAGAGPSAAAPARC